MIYLDHAATSFPKPPEVIDAMLTCLQEYGGNAGRGSHALARRAAEELLSCREALASFFGSEDPLRVVFVSNATMAINTVLKGTLRKGDHVLLSDLEHNAVLRPIRRMAEEGRITYDIYPTYAAEELPTAERILREIDQCKRKSTRMLIATHASNVCGAVLPIAAMGAYCRRHGLLFVVDAAQSAGRVPIHMAKMKIDALCVPGHKGLLGPQGSGALLLSERIMPEPLLDGGSGVYSLDTRMPKELPERLEAGTLPTYAIAGLRAGIGVVDRLGVGWIAEHERSLCSRLQEHLQREDRLWIQTPHLKGSILSIIPRTISCEALGRALDERGFCVRTGYHCAALAHRALGSVGSGTVRVSPGIYTTATEIDALAEAMKTILEK